jgi:hypothetical protein
MLAVAEPIHQPRLDCLSFACVDGLGRRQAYSPGRYRGGGDRDAPFTTAARIVAVDRPED